MSKTLGSFVKFIPNFSCIIYSNILIFCYFLGSPFRSTVLDMSIYSKKDLSDKFKLYWRILKEEKEIEVVMVVNGTSYAGLQIQ